MNGYQSIPLWIPRYLLDLLFRSLHYVVYSDISACYFYICQTSVYSPLICNLTGFQLHSGSEGGAAQPAIRQSGAGYDQTL